MVFIALAEAPILPGTAGLYSMNINSILLFFPMPVVNTGTGLRYCFPEFGFAISKQVR
jgi:hypothetical protein